MRVLLGDLFEAQLPAIGHGCNTVGVMGAGIAKEFRRRWPAMYDEYRRRCDDGEFGLGDVFQWGDSPVVFNLGTQPKPGPYASLAAIEASVSLMIRLADRSGLSTVGLPRIGCGLGGLDWADVQRTLAACESGTSVELVIFELAPTFGG